MREPQGLTFSGGATEFPLPVFPVATRRAAIAAALALVLLLAFAFKAHTGATSSQGETLGIAESYGQMPLAFEQNAGQTDARVDFLARAPHETAFLTSTGATLALQPAGKEAKAAAIRLELAGADPAASSAGLEQLPGEVNVLRGDDPSNWVTGAPTFARVGYEEVYPGIDVAWYGAQGGRLEYDFIVGPRADPRQIGLRIDGARDLALTNSGALRIETAAGPLVQRPPVAYQEIDGRRQPVEARYALSGSNVDLIVGTYDRRAPLVIDPVLAYSSFLGAVVDDFSRGGIAVDGSGNTYLTGSAGDPDFPTTPGAYDTSYNGGALDAFVTKVDASGSGLVYSTFLGGQVGGPGVDNAFGIAVDASGSAYITGATFSSDFPTTSGAFDESYNGGQRDGFVAKLDPSGSDLVYSSFLGASNNDDPQEIAVDASGGAYVTGLTDSPGFPATPGAYDTSYNGGSRDGFVAKVDPSGSDLAYSTFLGGAGNESGQGITVDPSGSAYVTGNTGSSDFPATAGAFDTTLSADDAFVVKLDALGTDLAYSSFLGGAGSDNGLGIALDVSDSAYVTGYTSSSDFPTTPGAYDTSYNGGGTDAIVAKVNPSGTDLAYSSFLGGAGSDQGQDIAPDASDSAYVAGFTDSSDLPTTPGAFDTSYNGGGDGFVANLDPSGSDLAYSSFLGGDSTDAGRGVAVDPSGSAYVTGDTGSSDFPTTAGAFDTSYNGGFTDVFVTKFSDPQPVNSTSEDAPPGGTVSTNTATSPEDPVGTSVTTPVAGTVTIDEVATTTPDPGGFALLGQQVEITAPDASAADPLVLVFRLDASLLSPGDDEATVQVFRDGVAVPDCDAGAGSSATPDPCVATRAATAGGIELTVRTSQASSWNFGVATGDTTPPETTIDSGPGGATNDSTPTFAFSSDEPGSSFECRFDAAAFAPCSGPGATHTPAAALSNGPHTFEVQATDQSDNTDPSPASRSFSVDTQAPNTTITVGPSGPTDDPTPTFRFVSNESGSTFQCRVDGAAFSACSSPNTLAALTDGSHIFRVRATDQAGNIDQSPAVRSFTVDTNPPNTTISSGPSGNTQDRTPTFRFSSNEPGSSFQCRVDNASFSACSSPKTLSTLSFGSHTFRVRAIDQAGNVDPTPAQRAFTVRR